MSEGATRREFSELSVIAVVNRKVTERNELINELAEVLNRYGWTGSISLTTGHKFSAREEVQCSLT